MFAISLDTPLASQCTGFTYISEDSSEITFLLVENYQLTALVGLRIGKEFLDNLHHISDHLFISLASLYREALEKSATKGGAWKGEVKTYCIPVAWAHIGRYVEVRKGICVHWRATAWVHGDDVLNNM